MKLPPLARWRQSTAPKSLAQLIEDVLDVSRIITGSSALISIRYLVPVIEAALDTVRPAAEAKDIQLESQWLRG